MKKVALVGLAVSILALSACSSSTVTPPPTDNGATASVPAAPVAPTAPTTDTGAAQ